MMPPQRPAPWLGALRRLHVYVGLHASAALVIMGLAGLVVTFRGAHSPEALPDEVVRLEVPPEASTATWVAAATLAAGVPLASPPPAWAVRQDSAGNLTTSLFTPNATVGLRIDSAAGRMVIRRQPVGLGEFLVRLHTYTLRMEPGLHPAIVLWSVYMELSIFALAFLAMTSLVLWLNSPRRSRLATTSLLAGAVATATFLLLSR